MPPFTSAIWQKVDIGNIRTLLKAARELATTLPPGPEWGIEMVAASRESWRAVAVPRSSPFACARQVVGDGPVTTSIGALDPTERVLLHDAGLLDQPRELSLTYGFIAKGSGTSRYDGCVQLPRGSRSRR